MRVLFRKLKHYLGYLSNNVYLNSYVKTCPYPVSVHAKEGIAPGKGVDIFDKPRSIEINCARMEHLESLHLQLEEKKVLDVGAGVGHLAQFFVNKSCNVLCVDGRLENIVKLRQLYPDLEADVADVETEPLAQFGTFDIVFAYGLLYHLENPIVALRNLTSVCQGFLLLETMVCDHKLPVLRIEDESATFDQALKGLGCRPSPSYVVMALNRVGFRFVYAPKVSPNHQEFQFEWKNNLDIQRDGHNLRCIFIASKFELKNPNIVTLLDH